MSYEGKSGYHNVLVAINCAIVLMVVGVLSDHVELDDYYFLSNRVVTKIDLDDGVDCTDNAGNVYDHLEAWADDGDCTSNKCFKTEYNGNFVIQYRCRQPTEAENPDSVNCNFISDNSYDYPHCCPVLVCPEGQVVTTTPTSLSCVDRASEFSCNIWNEAMGCFSNSTFFNFTLIYCRQTCDLC